MSDAVEFVLTFLFVCLVVAVACPLAHTRRPQQIFAEARHFFFLMVVGIVAVGVLAFILERLFVDA